MVNDYIRMLLKITRLEQSNDWLVTGKNLLKLYAKGPQYWLTLILLTWRIWRAPNNASRWQMGFNSAFKGL